MDDEANALPNDVEALKQLLMAERVALAAAKSGLIATTLEIEKLRSEIMRLKRQAFGRSSERLDRQIAQLELKLEEVETGASEHAPVPAEPTAEEKSKPKRNPLPDHLPREDQVHETACACPECGGTLRKLGEDVTEELEYVPGRFKVIRHVRPKFSCRACEAITQAPMPSRPIERGRPGPGLLAHVLVSKFADHLPLYRQSQIYAREGVDLDRSTLAGWVGQVSGLLRPLVDAVGREVMASDKVHADDTTVPVLAPGKGKTKTGRLWVYVRDDRPWGGEDPPAVLYRYSPDRKGKWPQEHLANFSGYLQADGYAGFNPLYETDAQGKTRMAEVACWAHVRRKFHDIFASNGSEIANDALQYIGALYAVEKEIRGRPPDERAEIRQAKAGPLLDDLEAWFETIYNKVSAKSHMARAIRYARSRWPALQRYLSDGRLEIDNNAAERAIRGVALGRKNWLFAGSDAGGERAARIYTLIETAKLNGLDPLLYLTDVLTRIADHPVNRVDEFLPWNWASEKNPDVAAAA